MLKRAVRTFLSHSSSQPVKCAPMSAVTRDQPNKWDIYAGVLVERLPVITKSLTKIESEYLNYLKQIEFEQSYKSDFEIRHENDKLFAQLSQKGNVDDIDATLQQTAQDLKDAWKDELHKFQLNSRTTEADRTNNVKSTNRKLEEPLILLVEQMVGSEKHMLLPQGKRQDGETMRQTAERVFRENCGDGVEVMFYGNAPCGFYKYKYPSEQRSDSVGAKIFFFQSVYKKGSIDQKKSNYEWLNKDELKGKLRKGYADSVLQFLM